MAADSDGCILTTVLTCEGNLDDADFPVRLNRVLNSLNDILGKVVKIRKLEPWNSVRVTLSIPREAALRLRQLASEGSHLLKALGILSIQVEGDQVISLRISAGHLGTEPQEIILRTSQDGPSTSSNNILAGRTDFEGPLARLFCGNSGSSTVPVSNSSTVASEKVQFKSPNVVCPSDSVVPKVAVSSSPTPSKNPFPFTSMNQAIHSREVNHHQQNAVVPVVPTVPVPVATVPVPVATVPVPAVPSVPPPPYPSQNPPVSISSPLLVNLLQNDGPDSVLSVPASANALKFKCPRTVTSNNNVLVNLPQTNSNSNLSVNSNVSPSALSNKHQTISTTPCALNISTQPPPLNNISISRPIPPLLPPPPYPTWVSPTHLPDITPSLTDLKADDLDQLLPSLEHDLVHSPPDIPELLTNSNHSENLCNVDLDLQTTQHSGKNFLINPLTGELEPQSSGESDVEDDVRDVFTDLPSPAAPFSDEDTSSTSKTDNPMNSITDQSDSDTRSSLIETNVKHRYKNVKSSKEKGRDSPLLKPTEKIKLRLKLEKSEPVNPAYKVDVSFINTQQPKKALVASVPQSPALQTPPSSEGLRVPPLHISLRGRNLVITNKKRNKLLGEGGEKLKVRKNQDYTLKKKEDSLTIGEDNVNISVPALTDASSDQTKIRTNNSDSKKIKKPKLNHDYKDLGPQLFSQDGTKVVLHNYQVKEKQKERRGSDSELVKSSKKMFDSNGILSEEKKRRLSQSDGAESTEVLGSTNIGTMVGLPKPRKEKVKNRELNRNKSYSKNLAEKLAKQQQITLPTGEIDMEAKFKQRLLEGVSRPHRTIEHTTSAPEKPPPVEEKVPEPDKCNTPDRKVDVAEKPVAGRSPNSGAQGEDSGIESMDALSEKSPNQASQSPHADLQESVMKPKTQVPDMMDIEAQLAKMEGLNGGDDCCISSALQDTLKESAVSLSVHTNNTVSTPQDNDKPYNEDEETLTPSISCNAPPITASKDEDLEPLPLRVAPPLYTYSNPEKSRDSEENYDVEQDSNNGPNQLKNKSLLEALLIEIPSDQQNSDSPSPATRSVRTRASSKLNSPEINLNSPVTRQQRGTTPASKRKRHESESSNHSTDEVRKKARKPNEGCLLKQTGTDQAVPKVNSVKKTNPQGTLSTNMKGNDESSDSDEPLIEKMRKSNNTHPVVITSVISSSSVASVMTNVVTTVSSSKPKVKPTITSLAKTAVTNNAPLSTRRSVRSAMPAQNTRSKGDIKVHVDAATTAADAVRRKTRSAVVDLELKRKKEVK